jgi:hypothetical protein
LGWIGYIYKKQGHRTHQNHEEFGNTLQEKEEGLGYGISKVGKERVKKVHAHGLMMLDGTMGNMG